MIVQFLNSHSNKYENVFSNPEMFQCLTCSKQRPQDFIDCVFDLREYDVPYHVRFAIDNGELLFI